MEFSIEKWELFLKENYKTIYRENLVFVDDKNNDSDILMYYIAHQTENLFRADNINNFMLENLVPQLGSLYKIYFSKEMSNYLYLGHLKCWNKKNNDIVKIQTFPSKKCLKDILKQEIPHIIYRRKLYNNYISDKDLQRTLLKELEQDLKKK